MYLSIKTEHYQSKNDCQIQRHSHVKSLQNFLMIII